MYLPFYTINSFASSGYFDIIVREKNVSLDGISQAGREYLAVYENLFLGVTVVEDEGPLQGFLQMGLTYENSRAEGQTSLIFNLEKLNFFVDLDEDLCQTWVAQIMGSNFVLINLDQLICAISPIGTWEWVVMHPEFARHSGISNFNFIPFYQNSLASGADLVWGIEETVVCALKYNGIIYWDYYITLDFRILFNFHISDTTAYLEYTVDVENCSISEWYQIIHGFTTLNLAMEWATDISVTRGLQSSPPYATMGDSFSEYTTAINVNGCQFSEGGGIIGQIHLADTYYENSSVVKPLYTSAIILRQYSGSQTVQDMTHFHYSQTITDYTGENVMLSSQMEIYFASNTLNIIFIILFNGVLSIIFLRKKSRFGRDDPT